MGRQVFITSNPKYVVSSANGLFITNATYNIGVLHLFNHVTVHLEILYIKEYKDGKIKPLFSKFVKCHSIRKNTEKKPPLKIKYPAL